MAKKPSKSSKGNSQSDSSEPMSLWEKFKSTVTPKKETPEFEDRQQQTRVELEIRNPDFVAPKDNRFSESIPNLPHGFLEFKSSKKLSKKLSIDATLDLHGLTQDKAYEQLKFFIQECYQYKRQNTLIITGKGLEIKATRDYKNDSYSHQKSHGKGILRRQLPRWLESPELRGYIHHYSNDHPFEGGTGAFFVRLRRDKSKR